MKKKILFIILALSAALALLVPPAASVEADESPVQVVLGGDGASGWEIGPIIPGQTGSKTVTVQNSGSESGNLSIWVSNVENVDGTPDEFETHTPGDLGELGSFLMFSLSGSNFISNVEFPATLDDLPHDAMDNLYLEIQPLHAGETITLIWEWNLPSETSNIIQGDTVSFNINYTLEEIIPTPPGGGGGGFGGGGGGGGFGGGGGGFGGGAAPKAGPARFVEIDLLGEKTRREISSDNTLLESYVGKTSDGSLTVSFSKGTSITSETEETPARIAINLYSGILPTQENEYVTGNIYSVDAYNDNGVRMPAIFSPPFLINHTYNTDNLPSNTKSVYLYYYDKSDNKWKPMELPPAYADKTGQLSAMVDKVLIYAAIANVYESVTPDIWTPAPANIEVKNLTIVPATIQPGERVVIRGEAVNTGGLPGEKTIEFNVPGLAVDILTVNLAPGQRQEIKYSLNPSVAGEYDFKLGDVRGSFTVLAPDAPGNIYKALNIFPLPQNNNGSTAWWMIWLVFVILLLISIFVLEKRRGRKRLLTPALEIISEISRRLTQLRLATPVVESIEGPTRRLKGPGPYKYAVRINGGKPPYNIEWKGNRVICSGPNCEEVELFNNQTWDSGKGNWVFFTVKDSTGQYAQWVDSEGTVKRLFTYGITHKNAIVTEPAIFPYKTSSHPQKDDTETVSEESATELRPVQKRRRKKTSVNRGPGNGSRPSTRRSSDTGSLGMKRMGKKLSGS